MSVACWPADAALAGVGLRREIAADLAAAPQGAFDFIEVAPENWIRVGGQYAKKLRALTERVPLTLHGLSLNIGGFSPIDTELVKSIGLFIKQHQCPIYSEHLSYCGDHGHLYDLMPIPFRRDAITFVAERILQVQDCLGQRIALENVSYYAAPEQEIPEIEFINAVAKQADCDILLDVNNVYVNSINHGYEAVDFMQNLPAERIAYMHVGGHFVESEDLRVDTHGAAVIEPVWQLLRDAYSLFGVVPTLLERDFNFPPLAELLAEVEQVRGAQRSRKGELDGRLHAQ